ncbi:uncharacterized protein [Triticum aestivum]|uniref:uncharacterized protein isoform X2 n=1 Tax=Triticum aestivum TaxID=4565 RepID=UPI001D001A94|nr:uncharacterized protein LOC123070447 isoform X2 [Triticum aestivum]
MECRPRFQLLAIRRRGPRPKPVASLDHKLHQSPSKLQFSTKRPMCHRVRRRKKCPVRRRNKNIRPTVQFRVPRLHQRAHCSALRASATDATIDQSSEIVSIHIQSLDQVTKAAHIITRKETAMGRGV